MRKFKYEAVDVEKKKFSGTFYAENAEELRHLLAEQNLFLVKSRVVKDDNSSLKSSFVGSDRRRELISFCKQFGTLVGSGISVYDSLSEFKGRRYSAGFKRVIDSVREDVCAGFSLSESFGKHGRYFPAFFAKAIKAGEASGNLEGVLADLADYYEREEAQRRKISAALAYPVLTLVASVLIVLIFLIFVIPTFLDAFSDMGIVPSGSSAFVFAVSGFLVENGVYAVAAIAVAVLLLFVFSKTKKGGYICDKIKYKLPLIGGLVKEFEASKFVKATGLLTSSGMTLTDALEVVGDLFENKYLKGRFAGVVENVRRGASLSFSVQSYAVFPDLLVRIIATGEGSGEMERVLLSSRGVFDESVENSINRLAGVLQPLALAFAGVAVCWLFLAVYSPITEIMQNDYAFAYRFTAKAFAFDNFFKKLF